MPETSAASAQSGAETRDRKASTGDIAGRTASDADAGEAVGGACVPADWVAVGVSGASETGAAGAPHEATESTTNGTSSCTDRVGRAIATLRVHGPPLVRASPGPRRSSTFAEAVRRRAAVATPP